MIAVATAATDCRITAQQKAMSWQEQLHRAAGQMGYLLFLDEFYIFQAVMMIHVNDDFS